MLKIMQVSVLYRTCLKQAYLIKSKDQFVYNCILECLRAHRSTQNRESPKLLQPLNSLMRSALLDNEKDIVKLVRVFTGRSIFVTAHLEFRAHYQSLAMSRLADDCEFQYLSQQEKEFVKAVVKRVCDKKPVLKFYGVGDYLANPKTEKIEAQARKTGQYQLPTTSTQHRPVSSWEWAYAMLDAKPDNLIQQIVDQFVDRKIVLI